VDIGRALFNLDITVRSFVSSARNYRIASGRRVSGPVDIILCVVDHFEPQVGRPSQTIARERVTDWLERYPHIADSHVDHDGRPAKHSFFYPWDEYDAWELSRLSELCAEGYGEIEIHLHHRDDTDETLRTKLRDAIGVFNAHGALTHWPDSKAAFGFIHGNWALDNSRRDHGRNYCGVNNEVDVLVQEGCYADFTFPAWRHYSQPQQPNSIYYAVDNPRRPKSYNRGKPARLGRSVPRGELLLIQGPLVPSVERRKSLPRIAMDDSDLSHSRRFAAARIDHWVRAGIHVHGRADRLFIKLHCHGAQDKNRAALLSQDLDDLFTCAEGRYNDGKRFRLHYATAREVYNIVKATEANDAGDVDSARNFVLPPPAAS
jgi:hypothetical protein